MAEGEEKHGRQGEQSVVFPELFKTLSQKLSATDDVRRETRRAIDLVCVKALDALEHHLHEQVPLDESRADIRAEFDTFRGHFRRFEESLAGEEEEAKEEEVETKAEEAKGKGGACRRASDKEGKLREEKCEVDCGDINEAILEYLRFHQFVHTVDCFQAEAETLQIRRGEEEDRSDAAVAEQILIAFDGGHEERLLQLWNARVVRTEEDEAAKVLEFDLHVYLATYLLRNKESDADEEAIAQHQARMTGFKAFLQTSGQALAQTSEYCPFYALPFAPDPANHPSFQHVFAEDWSIGLRQRLDEFLSVTLRPVAVPVLHQVFSFDYGNRSAEHRGRGVFPSKCKTAVPGTNRSNVDVLDRLYAACADVCKVIEALPNRTARTPDKKTRSLIRRIVTFYSSLEKSRERMKQSSILELANDKTRPEHRVRSSIPEIKTVEELSVDVDPPLQDLTSPQSPSRSRKPRPLSPMEMPILPDLDYSQVKTDMLDLSEMTGYRPTRLLSLILQALRWRLSKTPTWRDRERVVVALTESDLLGLRDEEQGGTNMCTILLQSGSPLVVEYTCRFLNYLVFHATGRRYLRSSASTVDTLLAVLTSQENHETTILQNALAIIQKLSLNRKCAQQFIEFGVMEFVVRFLLHRRNRKVTAYTTDYSMALLMNLCLHQAGRDRATQHLETSLVKLLQRMVLEGKAVSYVNGIVYSILRCSTFKEQLSEPTCPLQKALSKALKYAGYDKTTRCQMQYLELLLSGEAFDTEAEGTDPASPSGSEADNEEEQLEPEVDDEEHEDMRISRTRQEFKNAAELVGERLLVFYYLKDNGSKERKRSPILKRAVPPEMMSKDKLEREG